MARFEFRLKPVQKLRKHIENEARDEHARERQRLNELEAEGRRLQSEFSRWSRYYMTSAQAGMTPDEAVRINSYLEELTRRIEDNERTVAAQTVKVEKARLELIEKMKDRKAMDTLYEKQFANYTDSERTRTEHEVEEIITGRLSANAR